MFWVSIICMRYGRPPKNCLVCQLATPLLRNAAQLQNGDLCGVSINFETGPCVVIPPGRLVPKMKKRERCVFMFCFPEMRPLRG